MVTFSHTHMTSDLAAAAGGTLTRAEEGSQWEHRHWPHYTRHLGKNAQTNMEIETHDIVWTHSCMHAFYFIPCVCLQRNVVRK